MNFAQLGEEDFYINVETAVPIMKQPFELFTLIFLCLRFGYGFLQYRKNILCKRFKAWAVLLIVEQRNYLVFHSHLVVEGHKLLADNKHYRLSGVSFKGSDKNKRVVDTVVLLDKELVCDAVGVTPK